MATFWFISVTLTTAHFHHSALLDSSFCKTATPGAASLPTPGASLSSSCHSCCTWTSWGVVIGTSPRGPAQGLVIAGHQGLLKELLGGNFFFFSCERERAVVRSPHSWTQSQQKKLPQLWSVPTNSPRGFRTSWMPTGSGATKRWTQVGSLNLLVFTFYIFCASLLLFFPYENVTDIRKNRLTSSCFVI